jgi:chemotaxis protein CheX
MPEALNSTEQLAASMLVALGKSIANTFEQMVFMPATVGEALAKVEGSPTGCISGSIGLTGTTIEDGVELRAKLALIFSEALAQRIFRNMMMMGDDDPVDMAELRDVVGELTNMTAGGVKTILSEYGYKLEISLPTVAVGQDHYLGDTSGVAFSKVVPVTLDGGEFFAEISGS